MNSWTYRVIVEPDDNMRMLICKDALYILLSGVSKSITLQNFDLGAILALTHA